MSRRHYPPAHLRYFKARLWNLARPGFWVTAIFLSVVGLIIKEYWTNPGFFTNWDNNQVTANNPANSSGSEKDRGMTADNDNSSVLFNTNSSKENSPVGKTTTSTQNTQTKNSKGLLDALNGKSRTSVSDEKSKASVKEGSSAAIQKLENPFVVQSQNLLQLRAFQSSSTLQGVNPLTSSFEQQNSVQNSFGLGTGLVSTIKPSQNITTESALQTALNQLKNQTQSNLNSTTSTQRNPFEQSRLSTETRSSQTPISSTGLSRDTNNYLNTRANSTQTGLISGASYIQPGFTNQLQNPIPGIAYPQPGFNNPSQQNSIFGTGYTQSGLTNQPQNFVSGTGYPQPVLNNLLPQNPNFRTGYPQPGLNNSLPQNTIPGASYLQPQQGLMGVPQTPSAIPNRSAVTLDQIMRNRLNNINSSQRSPSIGQPTLLAPPNSATSTNIAPDYTPNQGSMTSYPPVIPNNYGNSVLQQAPAPVPQYIYSYPRQIPGQYTGGGQINRY
ncbi:hypothetical protein BZZ01_31330 [Nostocales cyanobacterium HT-58-2]|nr:hypothetical protein BZZ01_31330 [Nostocales cyanobacterium HT-58-2]